MENQKQAVIASYKDLRIYQRSYELAQARERYPFVGP